MYDIQQRKEVHWVVIRMSDVSMQYDNGVRAVRRATLRIDEGEFVFLVGPSGSGKSTLIKLLTGEVRPTSGRIVVNNYNMSTIKKREIPYLRRTLGVVFQDFRLIEKKTVYENVAFAMRAVGAKKRAIKKRVPYVLELVGLSEKADTRPLELSGGEQQRVAIARALVNNPRLIIADEPTGNLDPARSYELMTLFEKINELGTTILIVTHEKELVDEFEKRVIMIDSGEIVSDATGRYYADDEFYEEGMYEEEGEYLEEPPQAENNMFNAPLAMLFDRFSLKKNEQAEEEQQAEGEEIVSEPVAQTEPMEQQEAEPIAQDDGIPEPEPEPAAAPVVEPPVAEVDEPQLDLASLDELVNRFQERLGMSHNPAEPLEAAEEINENQADGDTENEQQNEENEAPEQQDRS